MEFVSKIERECACGVVLREAKWPNEKEAVKGERKIVMAKFEEADDGRIGKFALRYFCISNWFLLDFLLPPSFPLCSSKFTLPWIFFFFFPFRNFVFIIPFFLLKIDILLFGFSKFISIYAYLLKFYMFWMSRFCEIWNMIFYIIFQECFVFETWDFKHKFFSLLTLFTLQ